MAKILLVEDEEDLGAAIVEWLGIAQHVVQWARDGKSAQEYLHQNTYDLILLDWMLPQVTGIELCSAYRKAGGQAPVIILTAKKSLLSKEVGLDSGADDYLTKPFHLRELSARIRAHLRRPVAPVVSSGQATKPDIIRYRDLELDVEGASVKKSDKTLHLSPKEFALLELMLRNQGRTVSADHIIDRIWGSGSDIKHETVRSHIKTLRRKIDDGTREATSTILTVHGQGYKIE